MDMNILVNIMVSRKISVKIITFAIILIFVGIVLGYYITINTNMATKEQDKENEVENNVILDESETEDASWDPSHHTLINLNGKVTGRVIMIEKFVEDEEDQYHFLLLPDFEYKNMINDENVNQLRGAIMVEIPKSNEYILPRLYIGQHLEIQGPHVTDISENHGYNEIDPVKMIKEI
jgi:hypothetical protein